MRRMPNAFLGRDREASRHLRLLLEWRADGTRAPHGAAPSPAENAIANAMDELCKDMYNFRVYAFPPPKMKKG